MLTAKDQKSKPATWCSLSFLRHSVSYSETSNAVHSHLHYGIKLNISNKSTSKYNKPLLIMITSVMNEWRNEQRNAFRVELCNSDGMQWESSGQLLLHVAFAVQGRGEWRVVKSTRFCTLMRGHSCNAVFCLIWRQFTSQNIGRNVWLKQKTISSWASRRHLPRLICKHWNVMSTVVKTSLKHKYENK